MQLYLRPSPFFADSVSRSRSSRTIFSPLEFPCTCVILYVFTSGGTKLICAITSEVGCLSYPRNTLYSRVTWQGRDSAGSWCWTFSKRCSMRFRSGGFTSAVDDDETEGACDQE